MNILLSGGTGLIGQALVQVFLREGHSIWILTRKRVTVNPGRVHFIQWDGQTIRGWESEISRMDAVINLAGESLSHWPWSKRQKRRFLESRVLAGRALVSAIQSAQPKPKIFIQASGINFYGIHGDPASENTLPGDDFLSHLSIEWEDATKSVSLLGVRYCIVRLGVVLAPEGGLLRMMALPTRLFMGGPQGGGKQIIPWVHVDDVVGAVRFLLSQDSVNGPFNLVAPEVTTNRLFNESMAYALKRPYWLPIPSRMMKFFLGEMSVLVNEGRGAIPKRLLDEGYQFRYKTIQSAMEDLFKFQRNPLKQEFNND